MAVSEADPKLKNGRWLAVPTALTWWTGNGHDIALTKIARPAQVICCQYLLILLSHHFTVFFSNVRSSGHHPRGQAALNY